MKASEKLKSLLSAVQLGFQIITTTEFWTKVFEKFFQRNLFEMQTRHTLDENWFDGDTTFHLRNHIFKSFLFLRSVHDAIHAQQQSEADVALDKTKDCPGQPKLEWKVGQVYSYIESILRNFFSTNTNGSDPQWLRIHCGFCAITCGWYSFDNSPFEKQTRLCPLHVS